MMRCGSVAAAMLVLAAPRALLAQAISIGAGAAVLTTTRTLQGEPGGGVLGLTGQVEAAFAHAGLRADVTVHDGAVFTTLGGAWHVRGSSRLIDPFAFAGAALQVPTFEHGDGAGGGIAVGIGTNARPARSPLGATVDVRLLHLFRNACEFDPRNLVQLSVGLRLMLS